MNKDSWIMYTKLNVFCVGFAKIVLHTAKKLSRLDMYLLAKIYLCVLWQKYCNKQPSRFSTNGKSWM